MHFTVFPRRFKLLNVEVKFGFIFDKFVSRSNNVYLLAILNEFLSIKQVITKAKRCTDFLPVILVDLRYLHFL